MKPFGYTIFLFFTVLTLGFGQSHPSIELTSQEADELQASLGKYPLIDSAFNVTKAAVDAALAKPIEVPPPGEGGSSAHERHKLNYREMHGAGVLFAIIGNVKYAQFIKDMLNK